MKVAVVILNWNGKTLLEQFLPSVVKYSPEAAVYVADNASEDDSIDFLESNFPSVTVLQNKVNGGYAKGYNEALAFVPEDIYVLLNSDVEVTENWLNPVVQAFEIDSKLAAAQPKILDLKRKEYFEYAGAAGGFIDRLGYPYCRGRIFNTIEKDEGQYNDKIDVFWATGAALFVRRDAFWEAGGLDEDFFAHQEEIDLCWRLQANGRTVRYIGSSTVYHLGGATLDAAQPQKTFYNFRNTLLLIFKNVKGPVAYWLIFQRLLLDTLVVAQFLVKGKWLHIPAIIKAHFSFYGLIPKFLKKRKRCASSLKYYRIKSIVWKYFIAKKRTFNNLY